MNIDKNKAQAAAHVVTPSCSVSATAHWTAHSLACRTKLCGLLKVTKEVR